MVRHTCGSPSITPVSTACCSPTSSTSATSRRPSGRAAFQLLVDDVTTILALLDDDRDPQFVAAQVHTWIHGIVDLRNTHPDVPWPDTPDLLEGLGTALRLHPGA